MKLVIAAGGTGGHIYPGLAIAKTLTQKNNENKILFIGSDIGHEKDIITREGYEINVVKSRKIVRKFTINNIFAVFNVPISIFQCLLVFNKFRPDAVFVTGGYVALPAAICGKIFKIPVILHEQNVPPGLTIKVLTLIASKICLSWDESLKYFHSNKAIVTGNPVRNEFLHTNKEQARKDLSLDVNKKTILVFGGSQGAKTINETVAKIAAEICKNNKVQILHIIGNRDFGAFTKTLNQNIAGYFPIEYMHNIWQGFAAADIVVCRAGATTLSEIAAMSIPSILIPFPYSAEGHQDLNAKIFFDIGASRIIKNNNLSPDILLSIMDELINSDDMLKQMGSKAKMLARTSASEKIVEVISSEIS